MRRALAALGVAVVGLVFLPARAPAQGTADYVVAVRADGTWVNGGIELRGEAFCPVGYRVLKNYIIVSQPVGGSDRAFLHYGGQVSCTGTWDSFALRVKKRDDGVPFDQHVPAEVDVWLKVRSDVPHSGVGAGHSEQILVDPTSVRIIDVLSRMSPEGDTLLKVWLEVNCPVGYAGLNPNVMDNYVEAQQQQPFARTNRARYQSRVFCTGSPELLHVTLHGGDPLNPLHPDVLTNVLVYLGVGTDTSGSTRAYAVDDSAVMPHP
jgi:hypothetical protein